MALIYMYMLVCLLLQPANVVQQKGRAQAEILRGLVDESTPSQDKESSQNVAYGHL